MHVALSYDRATQDQTQRLLDWIAELGDVPPMIVCRENDADSLSLPDGATEIVYIDHVRHYPESKNLAFQGVAGYMADVVKQPYLYLEPDCVPTRAGWFQEIELEYSNARTPFLGPLIPAVRSEKPHMAAIGVYPWDLVRHGAGPALNAHEEAFPAAIGGTVIRQMRNSELIAHDWEGNKDPMQFALYHPDRDGKILENLSGGVESRHAQSAQTQGKPQSRSSAEVAEPTASESSASPAQDPREISENLESDPLPRNGIEPWANKLQSEEAIQFHVAELKRYCCKPAYVRYVRGVLKKAKVTK